jgi:4a-hydroxytetrahydrobiopterin dehydratase
VALLPPAELQARLAGLPGWEVHQGVLRKTFVLRGFGPAVIFLAAIAHLAEAANHHPDLHLTGYKHLTVELVTHSAGGLTARDFDLAQAIEALPHRPPREAGG